MESLEAIEGKKIALDTAPIIYFIEENKVYYDVTENLFQKIKDGIITAITSPITLAEVLVRPLRMGNKKLAEDYKAILLNSGVIMFIDINVEISELAAKLRAEYNYPTPDAIQIATAVYGGAQIFLTNDRKLNTDKIIKTLCLDDLLSKKM